MQGDGRGAYAARDDEPDGHATSLLEYASQVQIQASVLRNGRSQTIPVAQVVPGDIALLSAGNRVPADGCVLEEKDLFVNQALLTSESLPVEKQTTPAPA